ncbi:MAG: BamA/TamA family outer membrane protein [Candidatus Zixiibacteriota bacterium]
MRITNLTIVALILLGVLSSSTIAQTEPPVIISFDRNQCMISIDTGAAAASVSFKFSEVQVSERSVTAGGKRLIAGDSLTVGERTVNLAKLEVREVSQREGYYDITLEDASASASSRRGRESASRFASFRQYVLAEGDFVRGSVLIAGGRLETDAEINGNVVALFGDIKLGPASTCHRDVLAVGGKIERHSKARIYGAYQSTDSWKRSDIFERRRRNYGHDPISTKMDWSYNRVDGLTLGAGIAFQSEDNIVPRFYMEAGYGATSELWKYRLGFDHKLFDYHQLLFGGSVYRQTRTADDWICTAGENTVYALLRREDFRDYYQGEGAELFVEQHINTRHILRAEYFVEVLDSMPAHPRLWALIGGSKDFRSNFSSLPQPLRGEMQQKLAQDEAALKLSYRYQTVIDQEVTTAQGWWLAFQYEHSSEAITSDFNYDRYTLEARRYQHLNEYLNLNVRARYGEVTGTPGPQNLFYLGGIRTLRGHEIKEYYGESMALLNVEYIVNPARTILDFAVVADVGGAGTKERSLTDSRWHGDCGIAVIIGEWIRIELTRPFNGHTNELQPSVLIGRSF